MHRENESIQTFPSSDANLNAPHINLAVRVDGQVVADHDEDMVLSLAAEGNPSNNNQDEKQHKQLRSSQKKVVYHQKRRLEDRAEDGEMLSEMNNVVMVLVDQVEDCTHEAIAT